MNNKCDANLSNIFPKELLSAGHNLEIIGVHEISWKYEDALKVINFLANRRYAILGGDVYIINNEGLESTYDNWYINKSSSESFIEESRIKAIEYITQYTNKNGDGFVYSIIFEKT